jgi:hypothetical protein
LEEFDHADHNDRQRGRQWPMLRVGDGEGKPNQNKGERVLPVLAEIGVGPVSWRPKVEEGDGSGEQPGDDPQNDCHRTGITRIARQAAIQSFRTVRIG